MQTGIEMVHVTLANCKLKFQRASTKTCGISKFKQFVNYMLKQLQCAYLTLSPNMEVGMFWSISACLFPSRCLVIWVGMCRPLKRMQLHNSNKLFHRKKQLFNKYQNSKIHKKVNKYKLCDATCWSSNLKLFLLLVDQRELCINQSKYKKLSW